MTYRCDMLGTVLHLDSAPFSRKPDSELRLIPQSSKQALLFPGPRLHQTRERHHSTSSVCSATQFRQKLAVFRVRLNGDLFFHTSTVT